MDSGISDRYVMKPYSQEKLVHWPEKKLKTTKDPLVTALDDLYNESITVSKQLIIVEEEAKGETVQKKARRRFRVFPYHYVILVLSIFLIFMLLK